MALTTSPLYTATVLILLVAFSEWISRFRLFRQIGSALIVILAAAALANLGLIATAHNAPPLYEGIFDYIAPVAIFFLLLDVRLKDLRLAGWPMLLMFGLGSVTTIVGTIVGYRLVAPSVHGVPNGFAIAGMFTGTYIGGSVNLNAVALHYGVTKDGTLFAAVNAADNIITTVWIVATLVLPPLLQRWFPRKIATVLPTSASIDLAPLDARESIDVLNVSLLLALGLGSLLVAQFVSRFLPALPAVLVLTTIALALAQVPAVQKLRGARTLGYLAVLLFLAVIGAYCDLGALVANGSVALLLLKWVSVIVFVHAFLLFVIGGFCRQDWAIISVASNANIGGATSAGVLATALGRDDLRLPGILVGSLGNAIGTYAGIFVAEWLR
ncbi:MAG: DUF819 family protein [Verrucomicrobiota bacterium]|nr:DUF819 family protein [Verrucomicrobiota bacterium]